MSYICMIANRHGVAAVGDSRLTLQPERLNIHFDVAQKVYSDPEQGMVWACCGLMIFGTVNYYLLADRILRQKHRSLASRLNQITSVVKFATGAQHKLNRKTSVFTLMLGMVKDGEVTVRVLDVVNGEARWKELAAPVLIQSGWEPSLHQPKPAVADFAEESMEQMVRRIRERCLWAMRKDGRLTLELDDHVQTIGGNVRIAYLENKG